MPKEVDGVVDLAESESSGGEEEQMGAGGDTTELSGHQCEELMAQFRTVTSTDAIVAHMYLQQHEWILESAVDSFFHDMGLADGLGVGLQKTQTGSGNCPATGSSRDAAPGLSSANNGSQGPTSTSTNGASRSSLQLDIVDALKAGPEGPTGVVRPKAFMMLSWNVDGLDEHSLVTRTKAVISTIEKIKPAVVFLQEVVPESYSLYDTALGPLYTTLCGDDNGAAGYFTAMLLLKSRVRVCDFHAEGFPQSVMGRGMLKCTAELDGTDLFTLITTHLESCKEHSRERVSQLKRCFQVIEQQPEFHYAIFGGDLNLRDAEVASAGDVSRNTLDLWTACGSPKEHKFTWDTVKNDNTSMGTGFKPRARYDRLYWRAGGSVDGSDRRAGCTDSGASQARPTGWKPAEFALIGRERIRTTLCFPSDHFGILCRFERK